jgi:hypothetical protein
LEVEKIDQPKGSILFKPKSSQSIYKGVFSPVPFAFTRMQSTALVHGQYFGLDKLGHAFQQGYTYYEDVRKLQHKEGLSFESALAKAVKDGAGTESTYFGTLISGVYSNADAAANYAGYKIYENLTAPVQIDGKEYPALAVLEGGRWKLNVDLAEISLRPFISEHWNEARNPSIYTFNRGRIRKAVQARCDMWLKAYPELSRDSELKHREAMATWFGEPYGWNDPEEKEVSLATECFGLSFASREN